MQRRTFLRICSAAAVATTASGMGGCWLAQARQGLVLKGRALFPGVILKIDVLQDVPPATSVRLVVEHDGRTHLCPAVPAAAGHRLALETPYPYDDLHPGTYLVGVELIDGAGHPIERHEAGGYQLGKQWFSA